MKPCVFEKKSPMYIYTDLHAMAAIPRYYPALCSVLHGVAFRVTATLYRRIGRGIVTDTEDAYDCT